MLKFFTEPSSLKVGSVVVGPSTLRCLPSHIREYPDGDKTFWQEWCHTHGFPLYRIVSIVERRFLWWHNHYASVRRLSDGETVRVNLGPPPVNFSSASSHDVRLEFAKLDELIDFCREVIGFQKQQKVVC